MLLSELESNRNQATESKPIKHTSIARNYNYGINPSIHLSEQTQEPDKSQTRRQESRVPDGATRSTHQDSTNSDTASQAKLPGQAKCGPGAGRRRTARRQAS